MTKRAVPKCNIGVLGVLCVVLFFVFMQYNLDYNQHVSAQRTAKAREQHFCASMEMIERLHTQEECHKIAHTLRVSPHEMAIQRALTKNGIDAWIASLSSNVLSIFSIFFAVAVLLLLRSPLQWLLNRVNDFSAPLIPIASKKR
jgi:hypothetical protein